MTLSHACPLSLMTSLIEGMASSHWMSGMALGQGSQLYTVILVGRNGKGLTQDYIKSFRAEVISLFFVACQGWKPKKFKGFEHLWNPASTCFMES